MNTEYIKELYDLYNGNCTKMAKHVGITKQAMNQRLHKLGLKSSGCRFSKIDDKILSTPNTLRKNSQTLGFGKSTISKRLKTINADFIHGNRKHTDEQIIQALEENKGHITLAAKTLGIPQPHLSRMIKNRNLKNKLTEIKNKYKI